MNASPGYLSVYNFLQQTFFEIIRVLFYKFRFLILNYNLVISNKINVTIFLDYFLKKKKKIKKVFNFSFLTRGTKEITVYKLKPLTQAFLTTTSSVQFNITKFVEFHPKPFQYVLRNFTNNYTSVAFFKTLKKKMKFVPFKSIRTSNGENRKIKTALKFITKTMFNNKNSLFSPLFNRWLLSKYFNYIIKYNIIYFLDKLFFKLPINNFFISLKNLKEIYVTNKILQKDLFVINRKNLPLFFYKKNFFYFSLITTYAIFNHNLSILLEHLEKFMRRILGKRYFINHFLNLLEYYKEKELILSFCFLLRGTIEKHGRTLTFFLINGKLSLQTFSNIIYYDYIQCYQRYGAFGLHFWLRYRNLLK